MAPHMALFVGAGLAIGAIFTHAVLGGLLALLVWVGLQLRQLARLHAWLVAPNRHVLPDPDRKSVVSGKSVSVRVDLGGSRIMNRKNDTDYYTQAHNVSCE